MIEFFDGDDQPEERSEGPRMFDFKSTSVAEVQHQLKETLKRNWQYISKDLASEPLIDDEENDDERPVLEEECLDDETVLELQIPDELDDNADSGKKLTPNSERQTRSATNGDLSHLFKSKPGKSLYKVFGVTDEVKNFDKHHILFKDYRYEKDGEICRNIISNLASRLQSAYEDAKKSFSSWQEAFVMKHLQEPFANDMDEETLKIYNIMVNAKSLLKHFKKNNLL
ncbi:uncharacterized protein [Clytia hemisphaerica]|uniref:uncharacterized protein n=1 Tax=Clytia hemisphaerica TaxID=252671 RepID=UPI0034D4229B